MSPNSRRKKISSHEFGDQCEEVSYQLFLAEEEESRSLFELLMLLSEKEKMRFFSASQTRELEKLMGILVEDTKRHTAMLTAAKEELMKAGGVS